MQCLCSPWKVRFWEIPLVGTVLLPASQLWKHYLVTVKSRWDYGRSSSCSVTSSVIKHLINSFLLAAKHSCRQNFYSFFSSFLSSSFLSFVLSASFGPNVLIYRLCCLFYGVSSSDIWILLYIMQVTLEI